MSKNDGDERFLRSAKIAEKLGFMCGQVVVAIPSAIIVALALLAFEAISTGQTVRIDLQQIYIGFSAGIVFGWMTSSKK